MSDHNSPQMPPVSEPGDIQSSGSTPETSRKKSLWTRWWMIAIYVVLGIGIIAALANGGDDNASPAGSSTPSASEKPKSQTNEGEKSSASTKPDQPTEKKIPTEYKSALRSAEVYSETMHMSKAGIYDQLTSEHGENSPKKPLNTRSTISRQTIKRTPSKRPRIIKIRWLCLQAQFMTS